MGFILSGCVTKLDQVIPSDAKLFDVKKPSYRVEWLSEDSIKVSVWTTNLDSGAARFIASDAAKMRDFKYITEQDGYDEVCIDYCGRFLETSLTFILSQKALNSSSLKADLTLNTLSKKYSKSKLLMSAFPLKADISEWLILGDFKPLVQLPLSAKASIRILVKCAMK